MTPPSRHWLSREEVREVDRRAIEEYGLPGIVLMENAGRNSAMRLIEHFHLDSGSRVAICCGVGNNGGDGSVIARHLDNRGIPVQVLMACDPARLRGDAEVNFQVIRKSGLAIQVADTADDWLAAASALSSSTVIVDALLGTGAVGAPREPVATAIGVINASGRPIVAIDIPSGMDADSGQPAAECIRAVRTLTFVAGKQGFLKPGAGAFTGVVEIVDIGAPRSLLTSFGLPKEFPVPPGTVFASG